MQNLEIKQKNNNIYIYKGYKFYCHNCQCTITRQRKENDQPRDVFCDNCDFSCEEILDNKEHPSKFTVYNQTN